MLINCIFCKIRDDPTHPKIYQDDSIFCINDIQLGGAKQHILIISVLHIPNVDKLTKSDIPLLQKHKDVIRTLNEQFNNKESEVRVGFHVPPFYSIDHLHLHYLKLPISGCYNKYIKYGIGLRGIDD